MIGDPLSTIHDRKNWLGWLPVQCLRPPLSWPWKIHISHIRFRATLFLHVDTWLSVSKHLHSMPSHTKTVSLTGLPNEVLIQIVKCLCPPGTFEGQRATGDVCLEIARGKAAVEFQISTHERWETIEGDLSLSPLIDLLSAVAKTCRGLHQTADTVLGDVAKVRGIPRDVVDGWPSTSIRIWGTRKDIRRRLAATQSLLETGLVHI